MKDNTFSLKFEKEQPFSFSERIKNGYMKDDSGYSISFLGTAILVETEFTEDFGTFHNQYPWTYTFEVR